jgi:hypothetical protein
MLHVVYAVRLMRLRMSPCCMLVLKMSCAEHVPVLSFCT